MMYVGAALALDFDMGDTQLELPNDLNQVQELLAVYSGQDWNQMLILAATNGHEDIVLLLLQNSRAGLTRESLGRCLHLATLRGHVAIVRELLSRASCPTENTEDFSLAALACESSTNSTRAIAPRCNWRQSGDISE